MRRAQQKAAVPGRQLPVRLLLPAALLLALGLAGCNESDPPPAALYTPPVTTGLPAPIAAVPTLSVSTTDGAEIVSRETYLTGTYSLADEDSAPLAAGALEIRGRGHSTWDFMEKKPYRLKLAGSTELLGMPANRHWVLLANHSDKTLMRNELAFEFGRLLDMEYLPRSRLVDLELNGAYQGVYQLTEHVRVAPERVNVETLKAADSSPELISGGYLLEVDARRGEDFCFDSQQGTLMVFCVATPEKLLEPAWAAQRQYIEMYMAQTEAAIFSPQFRDPATGYAAWLDVDSAIHYFLVNELFRNIDVNLQYSTFFFKRRGGKLTFGPLWDFDLAIGNVNYGSADQTAGWHIRLAPWFSRLFQDPAFEARVKARWQLMKTDGTLDALFAYIDRREAELALVQARNFSRWPVLGSYVWPNRVITGSYAGEVAAMRGWLLARTRWMDAQLAQ
jgi:hypothetical protein